MMFTPTHDPENPINSMEQYYSSLLSPFTSFEIDGCENYIPYYYNGESAQFNIAESSNEPVSASSKMDITTSNHQGEVNGIVEQDNSKKNSSKRRVPKGDRHSKIPTAQGLRDRRIRLPLDVARQFFKLQDLLGYDKPSQTVKWLLTRAGQAIEELNEARQARPICDNKGVSSNSELGEEVVESTVCDKIGSDLGRKATFCKEKGKHTRKDAFNREAKEMRKKARERARERTRKKNQIEDKRVPFSGITQDFNDANVVSANWSQNYYHQEDQNCQFRQMQELQLHGWEPYYG